MDTNEIQVSFHMPSLNEKVYCNEILLHKTTQMCFLSDIKQLRVQPNSNGETKESQVPQISLSIKRRFL